MQLKDLDFNQIIIVLLFLGFLVTLQQLIKKNKFNLQGKFNNRKRINLVDEFGLSPGERIRLLRVDNKEYLYFYSKGSDYIKYTEQMIDKDIRTNNEFYVCPVFNEAIQDGKQIKIYHIDKEQMWGMGTPEDLKRFIDEKI